MRYPWATRACCDLDVRRRVFLSNRLRRRLVAELTFGAAFYRGAAQGRSVPCSMAEPVYGSVAADHVK